MTKVLVATEKPFAKEAVDGIKEIVEKAGFTCVLLENYTEKQQLLSAVADVDAIIIRSDIVDKEVVDAAKNLKIVVRAGAGYDNIDLEACTTKGVVAMNTPGQNANAVAELVFGMMIFFARVGFNGKSGTELRGKTFGIHAFGNIGRIVAKIARGFGMIVFAYDPFVSHDIIEKEGVTSLSSIEELYKTCQYVSLHIPATEKTIKSINYKLLSLMPKNAVLVNTARKEVINEDDMLRLMEERKDFAYIADVRPSKAAEFEEKFANRILFTAKKSGAQTEEANINAGLAAANQIVAFISKGDRNFQLNK
ncbi:MAG: 3-phosphoglycerate dehydrogenase [Bacteroidales bacterium]|jgi:D-3-phosphoglycerate dehydrogenase|nr:3-phosphoglycerate dehydrogenase [Bacteroidales bacterium]